MKHQHLNYAMLLRVVGGLLAMEALFMIIPFVTCLIFDEDHDALVFGLVAAGTAVAGLAMMRSLKVHTTRFGKRESYLLTGTVWVVFSLCGMLPFIFGSSQLGVSDSFFEAMSGFTTTGATIRPAGLAPLTHGLMMWQAVMQWLGGMGIILFTLAVIPALNSSGGMQMFNAEVPGITHDKIMPRISQTAMSLWGIYASFTIILTLLLWFGPMDFYDSICHAMGTISTGGFSTRPDAIAGYDSDYITIVVILFMFLGGVNFTLIFNAALGRWRKVRANDIFRLFVGMIFLFTVLFAVAIFAGGKYDSWRDLTLYPLFQVVSTITSTGYTRPEFLVWGQFVLALTFIMMFTGGCAGSTSGGAKIDRLLYLQRHVRNELRRCVHPNAILSVRINGNVASQELVGKVISFLALYMIVIVVGGTVLAAMGLPTVDSFFSAFACISNTGFGASVTGYGDDYALIPDAAKWVLSAMMLIGRLEIFTVLVLFTPTFWRR
ncbi:MAG: TrkH family potassium uptake protein [Bacteroidales bacterium]|nr:TrkH family potassium uptake protein [Bacteroidales bacterium]